MGGHQGLEKGEGGAVQWEEFQFCKPRAFCEGTVVVTVAPQCECTQCHRLIPLKLDDEFYIVMYLATIRMRKQANRRQKLEEAGAAAQW